MVAPLQTPAHVGRVLQALRLQLAAFSAAPIQKTNVVDSYLKFCLAFCEHWVSWPEVSFDGNGIPDGNGLPVLICESSAISTSAQDSLDEVQELARSAQHSAWVIDDRPEATRISTEELSPTAVVIDRVVWPSFSGSGRPSPDDDVAVAKPTTPGLRPPPVAPPTPD